MVISLERIKVVNMEGKVINLNCFENVSSLSFILLFCSSQFCFHFYYENCISFVILRELFSVLPLRLALIQLVR